MFNISNFLNKFKGNLYENDLLKINIINIIKQKTNIDLKQEDLEIKNNTILIISNPGVKNKIFIFKKELLDEINLINKIVFRDIS